MIGRRKLQALSRRRVLLGGVVVAGLLSAGAFSVWRSRRALWSTVKPKVRELVSSPALDDAPTGELPEAVVRALLSTTQTLVDTAVEPTHYTEFFRWRAETLPGYRALYLSFAAALDGAARQSGSPEFAACDSARRREILRQIDPTRASYPGRIYAVAFRREAMRFETYIIRQILALFSQTDGWVLLGYDSWPGTPRGLETYTKAPA